MAGKETLMACGCVAQGVSLAKMKPVCIVHLGFNKAAEEPVKEMPNLSGRKSKCRYCSKMDVDSSFKLPYFNHRTDQDTDTFYCGCAGWN